MGEEQKSRKTTRSVNRGIKETARGCESKRVCARLNSNLAREPHLENMVKLVRQGYNKLACLRGCPASLPTNLRSMGRQTQSWSQRLLKSAASCQKLLAPVLLSLPLFLSLSRLHPASLRLHSIPSSSIHKLFLHAELQGATPSLLPSVLASARCKKLLAWSQLGLFRNSAGAPTARALESSFKHKAHTQNKLFKRALGTAKYWLGLCFISIR